MCTQPLSKRLDAYRRKSILLAEHLSTLQPPYSGVSLPVALAVFLVAFVKETSHEAVRERVLKPIGVTRRLCCGGRGALSVAHQCEQLPHCGFCLLYEPGFR